MVFQIPLNKPKHTLLEKGERFTNLYEVRSSNTIRTLEISLQNHKKFLHALSKETLKLI